MYIDSVPNRNSEPTLLLRESFRENGKVRKRTIANITHWPKRLVNGLRILLKDGIAIDSLPTAFDITRSLPHGHVAATLGTLQQLELHRLLDYRCSSPRQCALALIVARILNPGSKLATARGLAADTARDSLATELGLGRLDEDHLYAAMDWLLARQDRIQRELAKRHLQDGALVLYDLTSVYLEGRQCSLAQYGYCRDGKRGKLQIEFGLLCNRQGCPVAVEVFDGNTADPATVSRQVDQLRHQFGLQRVVLVGDRGMLTEARIRQDLQPAGLDWISALRGTAIRQLVQAGAVAMSQFDEQDLIEIRSPEYPGERLMVCRNPLLAQQRHRKREALLQATEALLAPIAAATCRPQRRLAGESCIALRVGKVINRHKMAKHFTLSITDESFSYRREARSISAEAALDGLYAVRTSVSETTLDAGETVAAYKSLSRVERAFRSLKTVDLKVRPVFHYRADRVRSHVLLCMLAYYVEWHMRQRLRPLLFEDDDRDARSRTSVVVPAAVSDAARHKAQCKRNAEGDAVHSFRTLLDDLATVVKNRVKPNLPEAKTFDVVTRPTPLQSKAFKLLGLKSP